MAIRIIEGTDYAVLYCSTSMRALEAECGSQQSAGFAHSATGDCQFAKFVDEPPPALKLEMERDLKGAVAMGKVWGEVFDSLFAPKR